MDAGFRHLGAKSRSFALRGVSGPLGRAVDARWRADVSRRPCTSQVAKLRGPTSRARALLEQRAVHAPAGALGGVAMNDRLFRSAGFAQADARALVTTVVVT